VSTALSGTAIFPNATLSNSNLAFGRIRLGASTQQSVTLGNTGNDVLHVSSVAVSGASAADFTVNVTAPLTVAAGASLTLPVIFKPTQSGTRAATLTLQTDNGAKMVSLSGTGVVRALSSNPSQLSFGSQTITKPAAAVSFTLQNNTSVPYQLASFTFGGDNGGDFAFATPVAPQTLAAGDTVTLAVVFTPTAMGSRSGTLSISTDDPSTTVDLPLDGVGLSPILSVTPVAIDFGPVNVGATATHAVTVANTGTVALQVQSETILGDSAADFVLDQPLTALATVDPGSSLNVPVRYAPTAGKSSFATLVLTTDDPVLPVVSIPLSGEGLSANVTASATMFDFGAARVGSTADHQVLALTNAGNAVTHLAVTLTGDSSADFVVADVTEGHVTLDAGGSATLDLSFNPRSHGDRAATLTLTTDGPTPSTVVIGLSGSGVEPGMNASPTTISFGASVVGMPSVTQLVTVTNGGTAVLHLAAPTFDTASGSAFTVDAPDRTVAIGQSATLTVSFNPSAAGSFHGTLHLSSLDSDALTADLIVTASAIAPGISLPTSLDFGTAKVHGAAVQKSIDLTNLDWSALTVTKLTVDSSSYTVKSTLPLTLPASGTTPLTLSFAPDASGALPAKLSVFVVGRADPVATVSLSGTGEAAQVAKRAGCSSADATTLATLGGLLVLMLRARRRRTA
jgi:uncharacterized protein (TIGR03382 family)